MVCATSTCDFKPKGNPSPEKDVSQKTEKIYPQMENREKMVDAWCEQGDGVFPRLYEENWTLSVMEDIESSNEGSLTIVG